MKSFFYLFIILFSVQSVLAQDSPTDEVDLATVEKSITQFNPKKALSTIDSLLKENKATADEIAILQALKVEALQQAELYQDALTLSKTVLEYPNLPAKYKIRVVLQCAVIYEILGDLQKTHIELETAAALLNAHSVKVKYYGQYLIRRASYYRVNDEDSLALSFADKAKKFGVSNDYKGVIADADMLLGFMTDDIDFQSQLYYYNNSLRVWKSFGDYHGMAAMYFAIAHTYRKSEDYKMALTYLDSTIYAASVLPDYYFLSEAYQEKSNTYQNLNQPDSALSNYKKFNEYQEKFGLLKKALAVDELSFQSEVEKEKIRRDAVFDNIEKVESYNNTLTILAIVLFLLLCALGFLFYRISRKNRHILSQQKHIQKSNKTLQLLVEEKQLLLKELHHRVKNNLSLILSMITFQKEELKDPVTKEKFETLKNRIKAVSIVHEQLLKREDAISGKDHLIKDYLNKIAVALIGLTQKKIDYQSNVSSIYLPLDMAVPIGVLVNELISNSLKYAQPIDEIMIISLSMHEIQNGIILTYGDNGQIKDSHKSEKGLGLFIVDNMISQLNATCKKEGWAYTINIQR